MAKTFTYTITEDPHQLISKIKQIASEKGINVSGDHQQGSLSGKGINADYALQDSTLTITVQKKPLIVPWSMVDKLVANFVDSENPTQIV
jgi:hypothetical protein